VGDGVGIGEAGGVEAAGTGGVDGVGIGGTDGVGGVEIDGTDGVAGTVVLFSEVNSGNGDLVSISEGGVDLQEIITDSNKITGIDTLFFINLLLNIDTSFFI